MLLAFSAGVGVIHVMGIDILNILPPCVFNQVTGYYCFGCGGTRAVDSLLHTNIGAVFHYHAFVLYAFVLIVLYVFSHLLNVFTYGLIKALKFRPIYFYLGAIIIIAHCIIKNILLFNNGYML